MSAYAVEQVAGAAALPDLLALRLAWKPASSPGDASALADELADWWDAEGDRRRLWVSRHTDGGAVGMANAMIFERMPVPGLGSARWIYVANVFVLPEHRRRGVAALLMTAIEKWARAEGMVRIVLAPSDMSIPFYRGQGYREARDLMRRDLN